MIFIGQRNLRENPGGGGMEELERRSTGTELLSRKKGGVPVELDVLVAYQGNGLGEEYWVTRFQWNIWIVR